MVGFLGARGPEDETYIRTVLTTAAREHRRSHSGRKCTPKLCIMDARAYTSAVANGYVGGGRENPDHYPNATISYMSLANIHVIANSHQTLLKAVSTQSDSTNWFTLIESTGWLTHVADLLKAASGREGIVGKMLDQNCSLLVHCTDGWDRTTQLVSLAQILLDPYYRTIQGLRVLIEKEWLSAGHPFQSRTDALSSQKKAMSVSPLEDEPQDSWRASATMLHSSPNGAKESISFSRKKWKRPLLSDSESKVESKTTLPSTCLPETRPTPSVENGSPSMRPPVLPSSFTGTPSSPKYTPMPVQTVPLAPSPVFLLFLTCLHHIVQQHPTRFEYNDYLLVVLARAAAGFSPFGDFLYNNEHERAQDRLRERTLSIWKWVHENQGWFTSHDYIPPELGERTSRNLGEGGWREHVLHVQTGGRFTSLWTEYYFNSTPNWFPDPRMVLSNATSFYDRSGSGGQLEKPVGLRCLRHHVRVLADPWYGSQFDETQLQHIAFPGAASMQQHGYCPQGGHGPGQNIGTVTTIPPALASLKGQEMHMYYMLAQHLRAKRRKLMQRAFRSWRKWARRRVAVKPAREDGWEDGAISGSNSSQEDDFRHEDMESDDNDEEEEEEEGDIKRKRAAPELKILGAKKGIEVVMGRILESGPFFGERITLEYEEDTEEEEEQAARNEEEEIRRRVMEGIEGEIGGIVVDESEEGLEGAFDDFGFPVGVDEKEVFIAV
ncbi:hypothetical protein BGZ54_002221 [Gamsiella multidivaricata]|nr:hypothetical protein BGZ54_002221 [Gamsiella multidivaricata]